MDHAPDAEMVDIVIGVNERGPESDDLLIAGERARCFGVFVTEPPRNARSFRIFVRPTAARGGWQ